MSNTGVIDSGGIPKYKLGRFKRFRSLDPLQPQRSIDTPFVKLSFLFPLNCTLRTYRLLSAKSNYKSPLCNVSWYGEVAVKPSAIRGVEYSQVRCLDKAACADSCYQWDVTGPISYQQRRAPAPPPRGRRLSLPIFADNSY